MVGLVDDKAVLAAEIASYDETSTGGVEEELPDVLAKAAEETLVVIAGGFI